MQDFNSTKEAPFTHSKKLPIFFSIFLFLKIFIFLSRIFILDFKLFFVAGLDLSDISNIIKGDEVQERIFDAAADALKAQGIEEGFLDFLKKKKET